MQTHAATKFAFDSRTIQNLLAALGKEEERTRLLKYVGRLTPSEFQYVYEVVRFKVSRFLKKNNIVCSHTDLLFLALSVYKSYRRRYFVGSLKAKSLDEREQYENIDIKTAVAMTLDFIESLRNENMTFDEISKILRQTDAELFPLEVDPHYLARLYKRMKKEHS